MQEKDSDEMALGVAPVIARAFRRNAPDVFGFGRGMAIGLSQAALLVEPQISYRLLVECPAGIDHQGEQQELDDSSGLGGHGRI